MERKLSTKAMILNICSQISRLTKAKDKFKDYIEIIEFFAEKDYYNDESISLPMIKDIAKSLNMSYGRIRNQIEKIYSIMIKYDFNEQNPFKVSETNFYFQIRSSYGEESVLIKVKGLEFIPREGDNINIPFFSAYVGSSYFFVSKVHIDFYENEYDITVCLDTGFYNTYWVLRKDRAFEIGEFGIYDLHKKDSELKRILNENRNNAW